MVTKMCIYIYIYIYIINSQIQNYKSKIKSKQKTMEKKLVALLVMCIVVAASLQLLVDENMHNPCYIDCDNKICGLIKNDAQRQLKCRMTCVGRCLD